MNFNLMKTEYGSDVYDCKYDMICVDFHIKPNKLLQIK